MPSPVAGGWCWLAHERVCGENYPTERVQYSTLLLDKIPLNEGPITIDEVNDRATFNYWTWAYDPVRTFNGTWTALKANYLGAITAACCG